MGIRFEWVNNDVIIRSLSGNYLYTVRFARDAYHSGDDIIVIGNTMNRIRFDKHGFRHFE